MADLDHKRAKNALVQIRARQSGGQESYGNYVSYVKALPAVILQNGLGQALATELAASTKDNGHRCLFEDVNKWLGRDADEAPYRNAYTPESGILGALVQGENQSGYIHAQHEAMAYTSWLKKFAVAMLEQPQRKGDS